MTRHSFAPRTIHVVFLLFQANAMKEDVGYPSFIKDDSKLDALYAMVSKSFDGCVCSYIMPQKLNLHSVKI